MITTEQNKNNELRRTVKAFGASSDNSPPKPSGAAKSYADSRMHQSNRDTRNASVTERNNVNISSNSAPTNKMYAGHTKNEAHVPPRYNDVNRGVSTPREERRNVQPSINHRINGERTLENKNANLPIRNTQPRAVSRVPENGRAVSKLNGGNIPQSPVKHIAPSLTKAKTTEISSVKGGGHYENVKSDKKTKNKYSSDEGGNTVLSIVKAVVYITFVIVTSVFLSYFIIVVGNDVFAFVKSDTAVEVVIPEYATLDNVTDILYENDVIKYPHIFKIFAVVKNYDGEFLAGTYTITPMMNYESLLDEFKEKPVKGTVEITIPEGYTTDEIIDLFVSEGIGTREGFVDVIQNYEFDYWFIDELEENGISEDRIYRLDGYLFPDTYQFYLESSEKTVINKLLKRFSQIFTKEYREQCKHLGYTVDRIITLSSIIEKEAGSPSEFFKVSSVFHNRLNNPQNYPRLESDATIVYAIQHDTGERTVLMDTSYETPYNTYKYDGLPPGPIANPSASAMLAALSPQDTDYYFFIANKGTTYFSETKAQHDAYIEQFRNERAQQTSGDAHSN